MKAILGILAVILLVVVGYFAWTTYQIRQAAVGPAKEIVSESMSKSGDTWHVSFVSKFDAPVDKVYEVFSHPERSHELAPDNVLKSEVVSEQGNTKVIEPVRTSEIRITLPSEESKVLRMSQIRGVQKYGDRYRIAYVDDAPAAEKLQWLAPISFRKAVDSQFKYRVAGSGKYQTGDMTKLSDYVGPIQ